MLQKADVKSPVLEFGPDGCFGIDVRDDRRSPGIHGSAGLEERKFVTIQLRTNTAKFPGIDDTRGSTRCTRPRNRWPTTNAGRQFIGS